MLIEYKANVNAQDERGFSALMEAVRNNNPEAVKFLLDHNANPDLVNCDGQTALSIAESRKSADVISLFNKRQ